MRALTHLAGWALTPVHIGDGAIMTPESYRLRKRGNSDVLERFDAPAVVSRMPEAGMRAYVAALRKGGLHQAHAMLQKAADALIVERIMVSAASRHDIERVLDNPQRRGEIKPFVRSGGTPIMPGSSIKGAIRTAWLAAETTDAMIREIGSRAERERVGKTGVLSNQFQERAFGHSGQHTERDPMRDLSVGDIALADESTMIDKVQVLNRSAEGPVRAGPESNMQIHVERLLSVADCDFAAPGLTLSLSLATQAHVAARRKHAGGREIVPRHTPSLDALRGAVNRHHARLWRLERDRFYAGTGTDALMDALLAAFALPTNGADALETALNERGAWLLRIGRYSHFESKSVEGLRFGEKRGKNGRDGQRRETSFMREAGGSRTAASESGVGFLPFGWMLFLPAETAPDSPPRLALARAPSVAPAPQPGAPQGVNPLRITTPLRFARGDRVTNGDGTGVVMRDVPVHAKKMEVNFDGDIDPVSVEGYRKV